MEGLADASTGSISPNDAQLTKFHGTYLQDNRDERLALIKEKKEKSFFFYDKSSRPWRGVYSKAMAWN